MNPSENNKIPMTNASGDQPFSGPDEGQTKPRNSNVLKKVGWVLMYGLIAVGVAIALLQIAQPLLKMRRLNAHAKGLEKQLSSLELVQGQAVQAKGVVDGDMLTASDDPARSTFAQASLDTNKSLASLESEVSTSLTKAGFIREGNPETPYYSLARNNGSYDIVIFRYIKGDQAIRIMYKMDKPFTCPQGFVCEHTPHSRSIDNIYPVQGFGALTVTKMYIDLADKSSDYHSGYL